LDAINEKLEFPELKQRTLELYNAYEPDSFLIEAKAAGLPLIQELRATGIPVMDYTPSRGQDKISRVNSVSDIFANGIVWCPETRWAEEVIEQCAAFPQGAHGGFLSLSDDYSDEDDEWRPPRKEAWY
jgi:predicted phage terminase large subunit-like protein